ncbi:MAG: TlpA family protein disulfide reductase [Rhodanobacteraceae bacterium]
MRSQSVATAALCVLVASLGVNAASPPTSANPAPPAGTTTSHTASSRIEFRNQHGKPISSDQFTAAVKGGQRFTAKNGMQADRVILTLLPPGVNAPGSQSWVDVTQSSSSSTSLLIHGVHYKVVFHDEHGKTTDQKTFAAGASKQQRYTTRLDKQNGTAILTLLPIGTNKPGAEPTSIWARALTTATRMAPAPKPGTRFAAFDLPKVGGGRISSATLKGKLYVVDFFFADCVGCIAELPILNAFHKRYPQRQVVALTFDNAKTAAGFVSKRHFNWPVAYGAMSFDHKLGIKVYPTMVVVGADGKVHATRVGSDTDLTPAKLEKWVVASILGTRKPVGIR